MDESSGKGNEEADVSKLESAKESTKDSQSAKETKTETTPAQTDENPKIDSDEFNNAVELIRCHLKCIEKLQHLIVKNLFNEKTTTDSSMSIKLECADDQNYLTMETKFLTRTRIPNAVLMDKRSV